MWGNSTPPSAVIEFIEYHKSMGVSNFIFYVASVSEEVEKVLAYYRTQGVMVVVPWILPFPEDGVWYHGQMAMLNDCFLRTAPYWDFTLNSEFNYEKPWEHFEKNAFLLLRYIS
jgi:hypothetical protein